jgi:hypothetical protein
MNTFTQAPLRALRARVRRLETRGNKPVHAILALLLLFLSTLAIAAEPREGTKQEIAHLLDYLSESACQFNRNGRWYGPAEAKAHLSQKYEYLLKRGLVGSAEDFIARAASESSMTGKPYQVKCGAQAPVQAGPWLRAELARYRSAGKSSHRDPLFPHALRLAGPALPHLFRP